jgi:hypothetical protein
MDCRSADTNSLESNLASWFSPYTHHDAIEFPDGQVVLLTHLRIGQHASVLQLPAQAKAGVDVAKVEAQARVVHVG